jgi:glycosyltransferase involved in cell wall biosynthesis
LKVLHVIPSLSRLRGGPTFVVNSLARHQAQAGVEVHVATTDDNDVGRQDVPLATPVWTGGAVYWYFGRNTRTYQSSVGLTSWLLRHTADFDLVHIHSLFTYPATVAAMIAYQRSVPYIVRPLGVLNRWGLQSGRTWAKRLSMLLIENPILRRAAAIQFSTSTERTETEAVCSFGKAAVIPNPVDFASPADRGLFRAQYPAAASRPIVLFLARLDPVKGVELLLDAFATVRQTNPKAILVIAGSGDQHYEHAIRARAEALNLLADVVWTGFLDKDRKAAALADADVFVVPSQSESFGLAAVEGLAAGIPTVVTEGVGIAGEIAANRAGLVVPPQAPALAKAIAQLLDDAELASTLSARGSALVRARYRPEAVATQVLNLYAEIGAKS